MTPSVDKEVSEHLRENGLLLIDRLAQILASQSFLIDSNYNGDNQFPIYPVNHQKVNLAHNLLNLYGTHWRYFARHIGDLELKMQEGDVATVLGDISHMMRQNRTARYAFTQKYLDANKSLWIFVPNTRGWEYYYDVVLPIFDRDKMAYEQRKQAAKTSVKK